MEAINVLLALLLAAAGIGALYAVWRKRLRQRAAAHWGGWGLLTASLYFWVLGTGLEFGLVLGSLVPALAAWSLVWFNADLPKGGERSKQAAARKEPEVIAGPTAGSALRRWSPWLRHGVLFILAVPFAAVVTAVVTIAISDLLPWSQLNRDVLVSVLMPVLWGVAAAWLCADEKLLRPLLVLAVSGLLSAIAVFGF